VFHVKQRKGPPPGRGYFTVQERLGILEDARTKCQMCGDKRGPCEKADSWGRVFSCYTPCMCERSKWKVYEFSDNPDVANRRTKKQTERDEVPF